MLLIDHQDPWVFVKALAEAYMVHLQAYSHAVVGRGKECDLRGDPCELGGILLLLRLGTVQKSL